jgi:hypothetical protein
MFRVGEKAKEEASRSSSKLKLTSLVLSLQGSRQETPARASDGWVTGPAEWMSGQSLLEGKYMLLLI